MIKKYFRVIVACAVIILIFPVLLTIVINKVNNKNDKLEQIILSGRTIIIENDKYKEEIDMEYFIPCVLMAEMPIDSPQEALKAQAVVIRTYIINKMGKEKSISSKELKLPFVEYNKLEEMWFAEYKRNNVRNINGIFSNLTGIGRTIPYKENTEYLYGVVEKTNLKVLKKEGKIILPLFHETSNGKTRNGQEVLGKEYSYLKSVACNTDLENENYLGVKYFTIEEIGECLKKQGIIVYKDNKELFGDKNMDTKSFLETVNAENKDKSDYQKIIKIGDTSIEGEVFAKALGLNSTSMVIEEYEKGIRITTKGVGHGFGMSLSYAEKLAADGMQWKDILKTFYDASVVDF